MKITAVALLVILPCFVLAQEVTAQESPADLLAAAKAHYDARRYNDALEAYEKARLAAEAAGESVVAARAKLGIVALKTKDGAFDEGLSLALEAQATFQVAGDPRGVADSLLHLGNLHMGAAKFAEAAGYFRQCAFTDGGGRRAICLEHLGQTEESLGQYRQSMATLREAIAAATAENDRTVHASCLAGIADVYRGEGNAELAVQYDQKAIAMFRELGNKSMVSRTLNNLGISYNLMGRTELALEVYRENLALLERLNYARGINVSKMNIAAVLIKLSRHEEAEKILVELLPEFERLNDPNSRANVWRLLAMVDERRGDLSGALEHALAATTERTDDIEDVYLTQAHLGHLYRKLGRFDEARAALAGAIEVIESVHGQSIAGQVHFFDERSEPYAEMAILMIEQGRIEEAFEYAERYRSRVLIEVLRDGPPDPSRDRARAPQPVTSDDVAARLPRQVVLVEYLVTAEKTWVFVIAGGTIEMRAIDVDRETLARQAESFRTLLAGRRPDFRKPARELYRTLIAPIADLLSQRRSWILVPDGPLWNLPFQALVDARGSYLAEQAAIVYAPSTAAWMEMSGTPQAASTPASTSARRDLLAFGNPTMPAATGVEGTRGTLAPLPEAETEVKGAARFYGSDSAVYIRDEATEERFKAEAPRYRVLHVAGHGILNDASPMHSYLLLASGSKTEDGFLEAGELMQMDLGAELVVLSACDTARGKYTAGEGIIGFSWALFAARCRTQVVSQWKVDSSATSVLMRDFHKNVRNDRTKAASALQKTIVSMLKTKQYRHPFYWAGFVVLGNAS